jgi:hypothetical protein
MIERRIAAARESIGVDGIALIIDRRIARWRIYRAGR